MASGRSNGIVQLGAKYDSTLRVFSVALGHTVVATWVVYFYSSASLVVYFCLYAIIPSMLASMSAWLIG